jgi:lysophospholipase L1-like esterase
MGDASGDNWNVDNASEWTFIDGIGSEDIFTANCEEADVELDVAHNQILFNPQFNNSINYSDEGTYFKRSTDSEYEFTYSGTYLKVQAEVTGTDVEIAVFEDNVWKQTLTMVDATDKIVTLTAGAKTVKLVEGRVRGNVALTGVRMTSLVLDDTAFVKVDDGNVAERFVFFGDSITQGNTATNHFINAYAQLFKYTDTKNVTILGAGGLQLTHVNTSESDWVGYVQSAFTDTTTTKKLVIMLGTNDFLNAVTTVNYTAYYESLLDAIIAADNTIEIYCISPLDNSTADATLTAYDAAVSTICSTRAEATYIDGLGILTYATGYADTVHPDSSGHLTIHDNIDGIILDFDPLNYSPYNYWTDITEVTTTTTAEDIVGVLDLANPAASNQPVLTTENGVNTITGDGTSDYLYNAQDDYNITRSASAFFYFIKPTTITGFQPILSCAKESVNNKKFVLAINNGKVRLQVQGSGNNVMDSTTTLSIGVPYIIKCESVGASYKISINDVDETLIVIAGLNNGVWTDDFTAGELMNISLGGSIKLTPLYSTDEIGDIGNFPTLSAVDETELIDGLKTKYGF